LNVSERELAPSQLGEKTASLLLEKNDNMTAYPRHSYNKTLESLGGFVEAVVDWSIRDQGRRGGERFELET